MTFDEVLAYLGSDGWPIEKLREQTARSTFRGENGTFSFFIHADEHFIAFAAVPYARLPPDPARAAKLMDRLLHLNREINFAKFSVDDDGDVVLSVEFPLIDLNASEVRDAIDVLTYYADKHSKEVRELVAGPAPGA
jgi:hypothetical protein